MGDPTCFWHTELEGSAKRMLVFGAVVESWSSVRVGRLRLRAGYVAHWALGERFFGVVRAIVQMDGRAFAFMTMLSSVADGCFSSAASEERLVDCSAMGGVIAHIRLGPDTVKVLMPFH